MADTSATRTGRSPHVTGLFRDRESAENAYSTLTERGYTRDDIDVMMSDKTRDKYYPANSIRESELGSKALEGAGVGGAIGGAAGAIVGALAAIGTTLVLPGLGLLIAGPIAAALAGAGAGGLTGGLVGALIGSGIPEEHAKVYDKGIREGGIVVGVNPRNEADADYVARKWQDYRGENIYRG
jgi:hypothetical protein